MKIERKLEALVYQLLPFGLLADVKIGLLGEEGISSPKTNLAVCRHCSGSGQLRERTAKVVSYESF
jgi:hypothetical protein